MSVRIETQENVGNVVVVHKVDADTFDEAVDKLRAVRNRPPGQLDAHAAGATIYRGLGGLTEPQG